MARPFKVVPRCHYGWPEGHWDLYMLPDRHLGCYRTQARAIDSAYKNWPWWP